MIGLCRSLAALFLLPLFAPLISAESPAPAREKSESAELLNLSRKIEQQNIKIDLLSQQILRLQQEIEHPNATSNGETPVRRATAAGAATAAAIPPGANTHVVEKGETLTSIARMHKVSISELQKLNHIEDDRKLQIGQTLILPGGRTPSPSPSPNG